MKGSWQFIYFVARKLQQQPGSDAKEVGSKRVARPITRIAVISIALAMIVNLVTVAVVKGFQNEVRDKVTGFGSHLAVLKSGEGTLKESPPLRINPELEDFLRSTKGVKSVEPVAYKPALLQSVNEDKQREISGIVMKGVTGQYDWTFMNQHLKEGRIPAYGKTISDEILLSKRVCKDLHYQLGDTVNAYFVKQQPLLRKFKIVGIYETGLEEVDREMVFCHLPQVQFLNDWGIQASIRVEDTLQNGHLILRGDVTGGNGHYRFDWGSGFDTYTGISLCPVKDTVIRLIAADYWNDIRIVPGAMIPGEEETALPDTAYLAIKITGDAYAPCTYRLTNDKELVREYLDDEGYVFKIDAGSKMMTFLSTPGRGSSQSYVGSYELSLKDWDELDVVKDKITHLVKFNPALAQQVDVRSIKDSEADLFVWLGFLDLNMAIILILMLIIGVINMGSALLVMILVRTNFIGLLKAMGATNWMIRRIFILHAGQLIVRGMIWGNVIGIGLCLLQEYFGIIPLDSKVYYLSQVPIEMNGWMIILLNLITVVICSAALLIPSIVIARVLPSKAIRFR